MLQKLFANLLPSLLVALVSFGLGWWVNFVYDQPHIEYIVSDEYLRVGNKSVGNVRLVNTGNKPEERISFVINERLIPEDVTVQGTVEGIHVTNLGSKTQIMIDRLRPNEDADMSFIVESNQDHFTAENFTSNSGNIDKQDRESFWNFSSRQGFGILLMAFMVFILGVAIGEKTTKDALNRQKG